MYVTFSDARTWFITAIDGLRVLEIAIYDTKSRPISQSTLEEIHGMSAQEWRNFLRQREEEHELFASLAVLASFEGHIRRDFDLRSAPGSKMQFASLFSSVVGAGNVSLSNIFGAWERAVGNPHYLRPTLTSLRELYRDRNLMAHGKGRRGDFEFQPIYEKLETALAKWQQLDSYFGRR
ncbi:hypothetical protein GmRootA79_37280 [Acidovorax sp. A79]|uniref:hypothetical protein n=1 Tax=Acidovorax sp. A79 TaxID=3056107 RepID=UPI0034E894D2